MSDEPTSAAPKPSLTLLGLEVQRLTIKPGDALILHSPDSLTVASRANLTQAVGEFLAHAGFDGVPYIVLDKGYRFSVVDRADMLRAGLTPVERAKVDQ